MPCEVAAQRGFLAILVGADAAAGEATDAGTDQRALAAFDRVAAAEQAGDRADAGADQGARAGVVGIVRIVGLAGVGGATGQQRGRRRRQHEPGRGEFASCDCLLIRVDGPVGPEYADQGR